MDDLKKSAKPRAKAYLVVYWERFPEHNPVLQVDAQCFRISMPRFGMRCKNLSAGEHIELSVLQEAGVHGIQIVGEARASLAKQLIKAEQEESLPDCVVIPQSRYDAMKRMSARWKALAKRYYNALSFLGGGE